MGEITVPIVVPCPACPTKLSVPESAAGKQIRCPKCHAVATVPALIAAEEAPVVEAEMAAPVPKPKPKSVAAAEDEAERPRKKPSRREEEDDEDEPPRQQKRPVSRKRTRRQQGVGVRVVLAVVGVVLIGAAVAVAVVLSRKEASPESATGAKPRPGEGTGVIPGPVAPPQPVAPRTPPPTGWVQCEFRETGLRAYFPYQPMSLRTNYGSESPPGVEIPPSEIAYTYTTRGAGNSRVVTTIEMERFKGSIQAPMRNWVLAPTFRQRGEGRRLRWLGGEAVEVVKGNSITRTAVLDRVMIDTSIVSLDGPVTPQVAAGFFDNIELTR